MAKTKIVLDEEEKRELNRRLRASTVSVRDRQRAQIILLRACEGHTQIAIGAKAGVARVTVSYWCQRFAKERLAGLSDAPGRDRKPSLPDTAVKKVLETVTRPPANPVCAGVAAPWRKRRVFRQPACNALVGCKRHQAAPDPNLQAVEQCSFRGKIPGCHRLVSQSTGKSAGAVLRREITMSGAGAYPA